MIVYFILSLVFRNMVQQYIVVCSLVLFLMFRKDAASKSLEISPETFEDGKIVGGYNTTIQNVPYQVYLLLQRPDGDFQCGGSIINSRTVLTAAHCLTNTTSIYIRAGSSEANNGGTQYFAVDLRPHPRYNASTSDYDVAIVKPVRPIVIDGNSTRAIRIPSVGNGPAAGTKLLISGWGATYEGGPAVNDLMAVTVPVVSRSKCKQTYPNLTDRMVCAGIPEGGKDSCQGDSGGPAVTANDNTQRGVVSYGYGCARPGVPGVYARLANRSIRNFIRLNARA